MCRLEHSFMALVHFRKETYNKRNISLIIALLTAGFADGVRFYGRSSILNIFENISINFDIDR